MENWYIGQDIVAIVDHSQGRFKKGDVFCIKALRQNSCGCQYTEIDIGISDVPGYIRCPLCYNMYDDKTYVAWFTSRCFAPLDTLADITELTEHLANTKPFEVNQKPQ